MYHFSFSGSGTWACLNWQYRYPSELQCHVRLKWRKICFQAHSGCWQNQFPAVFELMARGRLQLLPHEIPQHAHRLPQSQRGGMREWETLVRLPTNFNPTTYIENWTQLQQNIHSFQEHIEHSPDNKCMVL